MKPVDKKAAAIADGCVILAEVMRLKIEARCCAEMSTLKTPELDNGQWTSMLRLPCTSPISRVNSHITSIVQVFWKILFFYDGQGRSQNDAATQHTLLNTSSTHAPTETHSAIQTPVQSPSHTSCLLRHSE